jgi:hypothetical protein
MSIWCTEFAGSAFLGRGDPVNAGQYPPVNIQSISQSSGGSTSNAALLTFGGATRLVRVYNDITSWLILGSSTLSTGTESSTKAERVPAGTIELRGVAPNSRLICWST